ncbi:MAG: cyclase family protein [Firmicutes bacterium]|nr:cyclase family protein [Bacillota bacterium]
MNLKIYDISMPVYPGMAVYKNKPEKQPVFTVTADHATHNLRETRVTLDLHTGTHIDAPLHMVEGGATVDAFRVDQFIGPCHVLDLTNVSGAITKTHLTGQEIKPGWYVLFKTLNSFADAWQPEFTYLSGEAAAHLAELGVAGVGTDGLGIERDQPDHETHKILFAREIMIIEGLRLGEVPAGDYLMIALPLKITGVEAAPARIILLEQGFGVM